MRNCTKIAAMAVVAALGVALDGCASCARMQKSWESDMGGGLERKITLYSVNGDVINAWEGKVDISESENEVMFDLNGKRTVIHGGITVIQEL